MAQCLFALSAAQAQNVTGNLIGDGTWVNRTHRLQVLLNRSPHMNERFILIVGSSDVTDLCAVNGDTVTYQPTVLPLPSGEVSVLMFLSVDDSAWKPIGSATLKVLQAGPFERLDVTPSISIANKGQLAEDQSPEGAAAGKKRFQELNGSASLGVHAERDGVAATGNINLVGSSLEAETLRFSEKHEDAPKLDLSQYLLDLHAGPFSVSTGQITHGRHRELLNGFGARGISTGVALGQWFDVSGAVLSATNIVGWENFFGMLVPGNRIYSGTIGVEAFPDHPGVARIEGSYVQGSQLPLSSFNQGRISDAEKSTSDGARLLLADPGRSFTIDAGIAWSRFVNPPDPLLAQTLAIVPVAAATRQARYADVAWDVLRNIVVGTQLPLRLNLAFHHERVDPLYRVVGSVVRSDNLQNAFELHGGLGSLRIDANAVLSEDNLANIPSVLKTKTRQTTAAIALPQSFSGELLPDWFPGVSFGLNRIHQFGVAVPTNSEVTPDRVPDQVTTIQTVSADWQRAVVQIGYRGTFTFQDNREPGRENADVRSAIQSLSVNVSMGPAISLGADASDEATTNTAISFTTRTRHLGMHFADQFLPGSNVLLTGSLSRTRPDNGSSSQTQASLSLDSSYAVDLSRLLVVALRGQVFARYAWNQFFSDDPVFNVHSHVRTWSITSGVALTIF